MSLQKKTLAISIMFSLVLLLMMHIIAHRVLLRGSEKAEAEIMSVSVGQVKHLFDQEIVRIERLAHDWGVWDDSYNFVLGKFPQYPQKFLDKASFTDREVNMIAYYDMRDNLYEAKTYDNEKHEFVSTPPATAKILHQLRKTPAQPLEKRRHLVDLDGRLFMFAVWPILKSDASGTPAGTILMGRFVGQKEIDKIYSFTDLTVRMIPVTSRSKSVRDFNSGSIHVEAASEMSISGSYLFRAPGGQPVAILRIVYPRFLYHQQVMSINFFEYYMAAIGTLGAILTIVFFRIFVTSRVSELVKATHRIEASADLSHRVVIRGGDELSALADSFNRMLAALERADAQQREALGFSRVLIDTIPIPVFYKDTTGHFLGCNKAMEDLFGLPREKIINCHIAEISLPEVVDAVEKFESHILKTGETLVLEETIPFPDGATRYIMSQRAPFHDSQGKAAGIVGAIVDLTELKDKERELLASEERIKICVDGGDLGLWDWNMLTGETVYNEKWAAILGYDTGDVRYTIETWENHIHPDDLERMKHKLAAFVEGHSAVFEAEQRIKTRDGTWRWVLSRGKITEYSESGVPLRSAGTHVDITDRKLAEQELARYREHLVDLVRERTEKLSRVVDDLEREIAERARAERALEEERAMFIGGPTVVFKYTADNHIEYVSPNVYEQFGYDRDAIMGTIAPATAIVHPDDQSKIFPIISAGSVPASPFIERELRILDASGQYRWVFSFVTVVRGDSGAPAYYLGYLVDITERKEAEEALIKSEKYATLARLSMGLSHEIKNPVAIIETHVELVRELMAEHMTPDTADSLGIIMDQTSRIVSLLGNLSMLAKTSDFRPQRTDVVSLARMCLRMFAPRFKSPHIAVADNFDKVSQLHAEVDPGRVIQLMSNLIFNAVESMPDGGTMDFLFSHDDQAGEISFAITDTGGGISEDNIARIFDPFYTTKPKGFGMGLSICGRIVEEHRGRIHVDSAAGRGTIVRVVLPDKIKSQTGVQ